MLADNLIFLRNIKGLTQEQVAEVIGISRQSYSKWEQGETYPDIDKCDKLAKYYGVTIDSLVHQDNKVDDIKIAPAPIGKHLWGTVTIGSKGQIVIPKAAREERIAYIERTEARGKLRESEKRLSQNIYERGVDDAGFGRIRSRGDQALFGGKSTQEMKKKLGVSDKRPLADFLPTLTIAAKNLATEMTNYNVEEKDLQGESAITSEHVQNNQSVRDTLGSRGIKPEELPPSEDIKKLERRVKSQEKKLVQESGKLPQTK